MPQLSGQVALVTGAGGGIGSQICRRFLEEGAAVVALDLDRAAAGRGLDAAPGRALALECDVTDGAAVQAAVAEAVRRFDRLTVLCATAGGSTPRDGPVTEAPEDEFWRTMRLDLFGTFLTCRHGIPELIRAGGGSVITMSSIMAVIGIKGGGSCYAAAKGGIASLTRAMAVDYADRGVRVNAISPGTTLSPRVQALLDAGRIPQSRIDRHLTGLVHPVDIAETAVFLASPAARSITGQVLRVDAGATMN